MKPFYIAPEVLKGSYDEKCDVWSAGVILYIILCGYPPFYGETNKEILEQVKKGKLDFTGPEWKDKSPLVLDLIKKMVIESESRLSAQEVLAHKWMNPATTLNDKTTVITVLIRHRSSSSTSLWPKFRAYRNSTR